MTKRVILQPAAEADIRSQSNWWSKQNSSEQALRWIDVVRQQIARIGRAPEQYGLSAQNQNDDLPIEIRDALVGMGRRRNFRAVFTIKVDRVVVLRLMHASQDKLSISDIELPET